MLRQLLDAIPFQGRTLLLQEALEQMLEPGELSLSDLPLAIGGGRLQLLQLPLQLGLRVPLGALAKRLRI